MKHYFILLLLLFVTALASCEKPGNESPTPTIIINLENNTLDITADGGEVSFTYVIDNPVEGGNLSASSEGCTWMGAITSDTEITLMVSANTDIEARTAVLDVIYTYSGSSISEKVTVNQAGMIPAPEIVLENSTVTALAEGEDLAVGYTVENPVEDGQISATTNYDWITGLSCTDTQITFTVSKNSQAERSGTINVVYTYNDGREVTAKLTVEQALFIPDPTISVSSDFSVAFEGGKQSIPFTINDPVAGGITTAECEGCDWITELTVTQTDITFMVAENTVTEARSAVITVTYTYNESETISKDINVTQAAFVSSYDHYIPDAFIAGEYENMFDFMYRFTFALSDKEISYGWVADKYDNFPIPSPDSYYFKIGLSGSNMSAIDETAPQPPANTYTQSTSSSATTFTLEVHKVDADGNETTIQASDGMLVLTKDNLQMEINLTFTDGNGETYNVIYSGDYVFPEL